ncbi:MAG: protein-L-isoaspartate o-methyltransferase 1 [Thermomicrobiales bacterium]
MSDTPPQRLSETEATQLAQRAVDTVGGARMIYRSPRQAFSPDGRREIIVDGHAVDVRWGEISSPAIATVGGYVFEILDGWIELLVRPPKPRA